MKIDIDKLDRSKIIDAVWQDILWFRDANKSKLSELSKKFGYIMSQVRDHGTYDSNTQINDDYTDDYRNLAKDWLQGIKILLKSQFCDDNDGISQFDLDLAIRTVEGRWDWPYGIIVIAIVFIFRFDICKSPFLPNEEDSWFRTFT